MNITYKIVSIHLLSRKVTDFKLKLIFNQEKLLNFSESQFLHLQNEIIYSLYLTDWLQWLNQLIHAKYL